MLTLTRNQEVFYSEKWRQIELSTKLLERTESGILMESFYVVIATANNLPGLRQTIDSIERCHMPNTFSGVVVVENGRREGVENFIVQDCSPRLRAHYLYSPQANKSLALNRALSWLPEKSSIFFTDDDVRVDSAALVEYSRALHEYGNGHYFGGPVGRATGAALPPAFLVSLLPLSVTGWSPDGHAHNKLFLGCNWVAFTSDLLLVGGFDQSVGPGSKYGAVGQESNMQTRLLKSGLQPVFVPAAVVSHCVSIDSLRVGWMLRRRYREGIYKGLTPKCMLIKQPRTYLHRPELNVVVPDREMKIFDRIMHRTVKRLLQAAEICGFLKGYWVRAFRFYRVS